MKKKLLSLLLIFALVVSQFSILSFAQTNSVMADNSTTVNDWAGLINAIESSQYTTITLGNDIRSPRQKDDAPFIISRDVTINGGGHNLTLNTGGIVLANNATFSNIAITFESPTRNAIIANGYSLTLSGVTTRQETFPINIFAGSVTGYKGTDSIPANGTHGQVTVTGVCQLGQIFAGSLSEGNDDASSNPNQFEYPATITIKDERGSKIGDIYAHGGREPRDGTNPGGMVGNPDKYQVTKPVTINLDSSRVNNIFGKTGGSTNAKLVFNNQDGYASSNLTVKDLSEIHVESGKLAPKLGSTFSANANVTISGSKSELDLQAYGNIPINNFNVSGNDCYLILGENQTLTINGDVTGSANVAIGGLFNNASMKEPTLGQTHIIAPKSNEGAFTLVTKNLKDKYLQKSDDGKWTVAKHGGATDKVELTAFDFTETKKSVSQTDFKSSVDFGLNCSFKNDTGNLDQVKMNYTVVFGVIRGTAVTQADGTALVNNLNLQFTQQGDGINDSYIFIEPIDPDAEIYTGTYTIDILVPVDNKPVKKTITLEITKDGETPPPAEHTHIWNYQADGAKIIATCSGSGSCSIDGGKAVLEIKAPTNLKFDGNAKNATVIGSIPDVTTPEVKYNNGNAPVDAGAYEASIILGDQTAKLQFTIEKADKKQLPDINLNIENDATSISVENVGGGMPENAKDLGYTVGTPISSKGAQISNQKVVNGTLTANIANGTAGEVITLPITISSKNYVDSIVKVVITLADKQAVTINIDNVIAQNSQYNGQKHNGYTGKPSSEKYKGQFDQEYTGTLVDGTLYNQINVAPTQAGTYTVTFKVPDSDKQFIGQSTPISFTIAQKPLQWNVSALSGTKVYDGTTNPPAIIGDIKVDGIVGNDDVKLIYTAITASNLSAADVGNYPVELEITNSKIEGNKAANYTLPTTKPQATVTVTKAKGEGSVVLEGWKVGETPKKPVATTKTNDANKVTFEYKAVNASETDYKDFANPPTTADEYTLKATFAETKNYNQVIVYTNFTVSEPQVIQQVTISVSANPNEGGTVKGGGQFNENTDVTVEAVANNGFKFDHWKENGLEVKGAGAVYTFKATNDRNLVAVFEKETPPSVENNKIEKNDLTTVPATLSQYKTIDELKEAMIKVSVEQGDYTKDSIKFYDVKLKLTLDNGNTWYDATESNFPTEGIMVEFFYKDIAPGVGKDTHDFKVTHMYSINSDRLGTVAGEMETPVVTKLDDRIRVTLRGLSPVSISWKSIENQGNNIDKPSDKPGIDSTVNNGTTLPSTNGNESNIKGSPKTGDNSNMQYAIFILTLSTVIVVTVGCIRSKKQ